MQLYALSGDRLILAAHAEKQIDYVCPECRKGVRLRGGPHRQIHFYHLSLHPDCRQHKKTLEHLNAQLHLHALLPQSHLEHPFPEICRIADVFWEKENTVFEIQYSPISRAEAESRCHDYAKIGLKLVWILHQNRFNQKNLSAAEAYLRQFPCYFTDIDKSGRGMIYDQFDICRGSRRWFRGPPLKISIENPLPRPLFSSEEVENFPKAIWARLQEWRLYFRGDLLDRYLSCPTEEMQRLEASALLQAKTFSFKQFYKTILRLILEKLCA